MRREKLCLLFLAVSLIAGCGKRSHHGPSSKPDSTNPPTDMGGGSPAGPSNESKGPDDPGHEDGSSADLRDGATILEGCSGVAAADLGTEPPLTKPQANDLCVILADIGFKNGVGLVAAEID